ncbi:MAG: BrnT family toxin, partial [Candidatus Acidiferrum sp.]
MNFVWDEEKDRRNVDKHGVSFEFACGVFEDPHAISLRDD